MPPQQAAPPEHPHPLLRFKKGVLAISHKHTGREKHLSIPPRYLKNTCGGALIRLKDLSVQFLFAHPSRFAHPGYYRFLVLLHEVLLRTVLFTVRGYRVQCYQTGEYGPKNIKMCTVEM